MPISDTDHDTTLGSIHTWFSTLAPDIATLEVETPPDDSGWTHVHIRPRRTPSASDILLRVRHSNGDVCLYVGVVRLEDVHDWSRLTWRSVCEAVTAGRVTDTVRLWRGREVGRSTCLYLEPNSQPYCENQIGGLQELTRIVSGTLFGGKEQRVIHYPPY